LTRSDRELAAEFGADPNADYAPEREASEQNEFDQKPGPGSQCWTPHYNIAPTQVMPVIELRRPERHDSAGSMQWFRFKRWGLIPYWAKDAKIGASMINARSETVLEKPALAESFRKHRVLVPADGFYEWKKSGAGKRLVKQPYSFGLKDDSLFCFAGIAAKWKSPRNEVVESYSILTTSANRLVADAHDRMPVILPKSQYSRWLSTEPERAEDLLELLGPFDSAEMRRYPVSQKVNSPNNDSPDVAEEIALPVTQPEVPERTLFG
jgi:putative SOS response-associated peptidase YedK